MKKNLLVRTLAVALTAVTVLTSSITSTDALAKTPKALKVQSFKRTGTNNATVKFKKPAKATKFQVRYSFYEDFRKGYTETSKSMKLPTKGKSKMYKTTSKKYITITTPKKGSSISLVIHEPRLQEITYNYRKALGGSLIVDGTFIENNRACAEDDVVYKANGYWYTGFYCAVQIRYYNKSWSKWSKSVRLNNSYFQEKETKKELSRTEYYVCGDGHPAGSIAPDGTPHNGCGFSVSYETDELNPEILYNHIDNCPYNQYGNFSNTDLVKYAVTCTWK